jgi:prepilin-type processing-associated H-X9-DG protein
MPSGCIKNIEIPATVEVPTPPLYGGGEAEGAEALAAMGICAVPAVNVLREVANDATRPELAPAKRRSRRRARSWPKPLSFRRLPPSGGGGVSFCDGHVGEFKPQILPGRPKRFAQHGIPITNRIPIARILQPRRGGPTPAPYHVVSYPIASISTNGAAANLHG